MKSEKIKNIREDKSKHIMEKIYTKYVISYIIEEISKTKLTPNIITLFNMFLSWVTLYLAYKKCFIIVALLVQVYTFLDNLDGILARYKNMKTSLGAKLDIFSDTIFYNGLFIFLGLNKINNLYLGLAIFMLNVYGVVATKYIVPRLKELKVIKRDKFKDYFLKKGIIIGMNIDTAGIIITILLFFKAIKVIYILLIGLFVIDLIYRLIELKYNERLNYKK